MTDSRALRPLPESWEGVEKTYWDDAQGRYIPPDDTYWTKEGWQRATKFPGHPALSPHAVPGIARYDVLEREEAPELPPLPGEGQIDAEFEDEDPIEAPEWAPPAGAVRELIPGAYWDAEAKRYVSPGEPAWSEETYRQVIGLGGQPVTMYDVVEQRGKQLLTEYWDREMVRRAKPWDHNRDHLDGWVPDPRHELEICRFALYDTLWRRDLDGVAMHVGRHTPLFGYTNVGNFDRTNMQLGNVFPGDVWAAFTHLRVMVEVDTDTERDRLRRHLATFGLWQLTVGERDIHNGFMEHGEWIPVSKVVPRRQTFKVRTELTFGLCDEINRLERPGSIRMELHGVEARELY